MKNTWVQDTEKNRAERLVRESNEQNYPRPKGSKYIIGASKSGNPDESGIYFQDPTG